MDKFDPLRYDSTYFLRKDGSFIFSEGYCHPENAIYGKIIYYPIEYLPGEQEITEIFGRKYGNTTKRYDENNELNLIPHDEQLKLQYKLTGKNPKTESPKPPWAELRIKFNFDELAGFFDHRNSLRLGCKKYAEVNNALEKVLKELDLPKDRVGCTGSLMVGNFEGVHGVHDDLDLIYYGTVDEQRQLLAKIRKITEKDPSRRVIEFGKYWPIRFYVDGVMICSFFAYNRLDEIPLRNFTMDVIEEDVILSGKVQDDTHAIFMPPVLGLTDVQVNGKPVEDTTLVIYDGSMRGDFFKDDEIESRCKKVYIKGEGTHCNREAYLLTISKNVLSVNQPGRSH
jgi:hypothetical protein